MGKVKTDTCDGRSRIWPDTGEGKDFVVRSRKSAGIYDFFRGSAEVSSAAVVAQACPGLQQIIIGRVGERWNIGKAREESLIVRNYRGDTRLLQHDLRDPDAVRLAGVAPREV